MSDQFYMMNLIEKLHPNETKKRTVGIEDEVLEAANDPHVYEMCVIGLVAEERMMFYRELVKESISFGQSGHHGRKSVLTRLCYSALHILVRGISVDITANYHVLGDDEPDLLPLISILSAFSWIVSGLWIPEQANPFDEKQWIGNNDLSRDKVKLVYKHDSTHWSVALLIDCILDHDDLLLNLLGLLDIEKHETIPLMVFYIFAKQNIKTWIEPFHELFLQKALYSLPMYNPPVNMSNTFPVKFSRQYSSPHVKILWEQHVYSSISKLFELNHVSQDVVSMGIHEFMRDVMKNILVSLTSVTVLQEPDNTDSIVSLDYLDAMIRVIYSVPQEYLWLAVDYILQDISNIGQLLSGVIREKPSSLQIYSMVAVWNTVLYVLSLLSTTPVEDYIREEKNLGNDVYISTGKPLQQYLLEYEKKRKSIVALNPSVDPLHAILSHRFSDTVDFLNANKIKFFEMVTPKQGVGMLAIPLQNLLRNSRLGASLCYSNLIYVLRSFEIWHVPSGGLKLILRCLHHLLLNVPGGLVVVGESHSPVLNNQRSEYLKSFLISSNALFQLLENIPSTFWKDIKAISVSVGHASKSSNATSNSLVNLPLLLDLMVDSLNGCSEILGRLRQHSSEIISSTMSSTDKARTSSINFELVLMFERLFAISRGWHRVVSLDAVLNGLLSPKQYGSINESFYSNSPKQYSGAHYLRVLSSGNSPLKSSEAVIFYDLIEELHRIIDGENAIGSSNQTIVPVHPFDNGLFNFKNIFDQHHVSSISPKLREDHLQTGNVIFHLKRIATCFACCCDFIFTISKIGKVSITGTTEMSYYEEQSISWQLGMILNSLRIAWQYHIYSLALALFEHIVPHLGEEKGCTAQNAYMTTQLECGNSLCTMFPSPLRSFPFSAGSQDNFSAKDVHEVIEQLIICSSFPPAIDVTQELLQIFHHVMEHLCVALQGLPPRSKLFQEALQCQTLILESIWWFLHRITGFSVELSVGTIDCGNTEILNHLRRESEGKFSSHGDYLKVSLVDRLEFLSNHLGIYLPINSAQSCETAKEEIQHAASYVMLWTLLHFYFQNQGIRKEPHVIYVAFSCCMNGLTESAMLPSLCGFLPPLVANYSLHKFGAENMISHSPSLLVFVAYFLKLVYCKLSQMTSPSPSEQQEEDLMITMTGGMRVMCSIPLLLVSASEYSFLEMSDANKKNGDILDHEDLLYSCLKSCETNMMTMLSLWFDLEQICENFQVRHGSNSLSTYDFYEVDREPLRLRFGGYTEVNGWEVSASVHTRATVISLLAQKVNAIYKTKFLPHNTSIGSCTIASSICELWIKQLLRQCCGLTLRVVLEFGLLSAAHNQLDKRFWSDVITVLKIWTAFSPHVLRFLPWMSSFVLDVNLFLSPTELTGILLSFHIKHILSVANALYCMFLEIFPEEKSILLLTRESVEFGDWYAGISFNKSAKNDSQSWLEIIDRFPDHADRHSCWGQSIRAIAELLASHEDFDLIDRTIGSDLRGCGSEVHKFGGRYLVGKIEGEVSKGMGSPSRKRIPIEFELEGDQPIEMSPTAKSNDNLENGADTGVRCGDANTGSATQTPVATSRIFIKTDGKPAGNHTLTPSCSSPPIILKRTRQEFEPAADNHVDLEILMEPKQLRSDSLSQPTLTKPTIAVAINSPNLDSAAEKVSIICAQRIADIPKSTNLEHLPECVGKAISTSDHLNASMSLDVAFNELKRSVAEYQRSDTNHSLLWKALEDCQDLGNVIIKLLKQQEAK